MHNQMASAVDAAVNVTVTTPQGVRYDELHELQFATGLSKQNRQQENFKPRGCYLDSSRGWHCIVVGALANLCTTEQAISNRHIAARRQAAAAAKKWIVQPVARYQVVVPVIPPPDFPINQPREATADTSQAGDSTATQEILPAGGDSGERSTPAAAVACPNSREVQANMVYPAPARRSGIQGDVIARFVVGANGSIRDIAIISSTSQTLNLAAINAVAQFRCVGQGQDIVVEAPFSFKLHD